MITKVEFSFIDEISRPNRVLRIATAPGLHLSAAVWTTPRLDSIVNARLACLRHAFAEVTCKCPLSESWVIVGHRAVQPNNRITNYHRIWKSLKKRNIALPPDDFLDDMLASAEGVRFFGAARFRAEQLDWVHQLMINEQAAIIIINEQDAKSTMTRLVRRGWAARNTQPPQELLEACFSEKIAIMDVYGAFDDPDVSVAAIGKRGAVIDLTCGKRDRFQY